MTGRHEGAAVVFPKLLLRIPVITGNTPSTLLKEVEVRGRDGRRGVRRL